MLTIKDTCPIHTEAPDTIVPVITLNGNSNVELKVNDKYIEEGATAVDEKDGDITAQIIMTGNVDTTKEGTYTLTYTVKDAAGNEATTTRTVVVKKVEEKDTTKPEIKLNGKSKIELEMGATYTEQGAKATDNKDGDITAKIVTTIEPGGKVDTSKEGTYIITYKVTDMVGNEATETRTVSVKAKNETPPSTEPPIQEEPPVTEEPDIDEEQPATM